MLPTVHADYRQVAVKPPLIAGDDLPDFWCRVEEGVHIIFVAHPATQRLRYPLAYDTTTREAPIRRDLTLRIGESEHAVALHLQPGQSALLTASHAGVEVRILELGQPPR